MILWRDEIEDRTTFSEEEMKAFEHLVNKDERLIPLEEGEEYCCADGCNGEITPVERMFALYLEFNKEGVLKKALYYKSYFPSCCYRHNEESRLMIWTGEIAKPAVAAVKEP